MTCEVVINGKSSKRFKNSIANYGEERGVWNYIKDLEALYKRINGGHAKTKEILVFPDELETTMEDYLDLHPVQGPDKGKYKTIIVKNPHYIDQLAELEQNMKRSFLQISNKQLKKPLEHLNSRVNAFLSQLGVEVKNVDTIVDHEGNPINAIAKASILKKIIEVVEGKADATTLPEEAAHFLIEFLGDDHPLVQRMMSSIISTDTFKQVVAEYGNVYGNDTVKLAKEAIAKLIVDKMINQTSKPTAEEKTWFNRLMYIIKNLFSSVSTKDINDSLDEFNEAAEMILNPEKLSKETSNLDNSTITEMYQLTNTATQEEVNNKLDITQREIKSPGYTSETDDRYKKATGETVKKRVTDLQKKLFDRLVGKDKAKDINADPDNVIKRNFGIFLHGVAQQYLNFKLNGGPDVNTSLTLDGKLYTLTAEQYKTLTDYLNNIILDIETTQNNINPKGKATVRLENIIYDPKQDLAGSLDTLVIFSDGSASIYDYKFVSLEEVDGVVNTDKLYNKEDSWDVQMSEYKKILREQYGIEKFNKTRMLPINVRYKKSGGKLVSKIHSINTSIDPVPIRELTDDAKLNELLAKLIAQKDKLKKELKTSPHVNRTKIRIRNLTDSIRQIQLNKDVSFILNEISSTAKVVHNSLGINDKNDPGYITDEELRDYKETMLMYSKIAASTRNIFREMKDQEEYAELRDKLERAQLSVALILDNIQDELKERALAEAEKLNIKGILDPQKEGNPLGVLLTHLSQMQHPIFKALWSFIKSSQDKTRNATEDLAKRLEEKTKALKEWGKKQGLSGTDIFNSIINPKTGNLIPEFDENLFKTIEDQRSKKNAEWFKENYMQTEEDKQKFEKRKAEEFRRIELGYASRGPEFVQRLKDNWLMENDLANDSAWVSKFSNKTLKDKSKWQSEAYKNLTKPGNEALLDYYNFYKEVTKEINEILPIDIKSNFVANIHKDMVDMVGEIGISSVGKLKESFLQSLQVREEESNIAYNDPTTGKPVYNAPILFTTPLTDSNGNVDPSLKSRDLSSSLLLFANMAYNYKHMNEIKSSALNMREVLASSDQILTDAFGRPLKREGKYIVGEGNKKSLEAYDSFLNYYIGGQSIQTKDSAFNYKDKSYSRNKIIRQAMSYFSMTKLGLNPISATANYLGAKANLYFVATKEAYFTKKQMHESEKLFAKQDKKYLQAINFFNIGAHNHTLSKARNLTTSQLSKMLSAETMYALQRAGDAAIERQITASMLMNYGLSKTGKVTKLSELEQGAKSLWDMMELKDDKIDSSFLTEEQFNDFRRKVDYVAGIVKGQNSEEDIALYKTTLMGAMLGQFRGWMPRMVKERFGEPRYVEDIEQIELGRFRVVLGEFLQGGMLNSMKIFLDGLPIINYKYDQKAAEYYYKKHLEANPQLDPTTFTLEKYIEVRKGQIKAAAAEIRLYALFLGVIAALAGDWDDDDEPDYKKYWAARRFIALMDRTQLELGFFLNPSNVTELIKSPLPIWGLITDTQKLLENTADESRDTFLGENSSQDRTPIAYRTSRMIPLIKPGVDFFEVFEDTGDDVKYKPKKDEAGIQLEY